MVGERIKAERDKLGWSQSELARRSGLSQAFISQLESGERRELGMKAAQKLARALSIGIETLISDTPPIDLSQPPIEQARAIGIPQTDLDALQRRWPAWSETRKRDYLRQVETAQRQQQQLRALTEDDDPGAPTQTPILAGIL